MGLGAPWDDAYLQPQPKEKSSVMFTNLEPQPKIFFVMFVNIESQPTEQSSVMVLDLETKKGENLLWYFKKNR